MHFQVIRKEPPDGPLERIKYFVDSRIKPHTRERLNIIIHDQIPPFRNTKGDCIRVAMLSYLHYMDPQCELDLDTFRTILCGPGKNDGTNIARAVVAMAAMGVPAMAYAENFDRIDRHDADLALEYNLLAQRVITPDDIQYSLINNKGVVCAVDPAGVYGWPPEGSSSHAVVMTGFGKGHYVFHENMRHPKNTRSTGKPHRVTPMKPFEKGRAMHDFHTLVMGPAPDINEHRKLLRKLVKACERADVRSARQQQPAGVTL